MRATYNRCRVALAISIAALASYIAPSLSAGVARLTRLVAAVRRMHKRRTAWTSVGGSGHRPLPPRWGVRRTC
jgi:NO-binding membrane sensor protein with MHYT domain